MEEAEEARVVVVRLEAVEEDIGAPTLVFSLWVCEGTSFSLEVFLPSFFWKRAD